MSVNNLLQWYDKANSRELNEGREWYAIAAADCKALSKRYNVEFERIVFATAALSPGLQWEKNIAAVKTVLDGGHPGGCYPSNIEKAYHILFDESDWKRFLSGPKVENFASNISGNSDKVTIDRWAFRAWSNRKDYPTLSESEIFEIAADYRSAAAKVDLTPSEFQAVVWIMIRKYAKAKVAKSQLRLPLDV